MEIIFNQNVLSLDSLVESGFDVIDNNDSDDDIFEPIYEDARWTKLSPSTQLIISNFDSIDDAIIHAHHLNFFKKQPSWIVEILNINR